MSDLRYQRLIYFLKKKSEIHKMASTFIPCLRQKLKIKLQEEERYSERNNNNNKQLSKHISLHGSDLTMAFIRFCNNFARSPCTAPASCGVCKQLNENEEQGIHRFKASRTQGTTDHIRTSIMATVAAISKITKWRAPSSNSI